MTTRYGILAGLCALVLATALPVGTPGPALAADAFLAGIDDLPLMAGLAEIGDAGSTFDTAAGRIVEAYAQGPKATPAQAEAFYAETLPQLGWAPIAPRTYRRDGEVLTMDVIAERPLVVRFTVAPE